MTRYMSKDSNEARFQPAQVAPAGQSIEYQSRSIVSREIVKGVNGKVMLFAFDEGEGLSEHTSPFNELVQVIEGEAEVTISAKSNQVRGVEMILMPVGQPHALNARNHSK